MQEVIHVRGRSYDGGNGEPAKIFIMESSVSAKESSRCQAVDRRQSHFHRAQHGISVQDGAGQQALPLRGSGRRRQAGGERCHEDGDQEQHRGHRHPARGQGEPSGAACGEGRTQPRRRARRQGRCLPARPIPRGSARSAAIAAERSRRRYRIGRAYPVSRPGRVRSGEHAAAGARWRGRRWPARGARAPRRSPDAARARAWRN